MSADKRCVLAIHNGIDGSLGVIESTLENNGYMVITAFECRQGSYEIKKTSTAISLVICLGTEFYGKDGQLEHYQKFVKNLRAVNPDIPIIFIIPYNLEQIEGLIEENITYLKMPWKPKNLIEGVNTALRVC